jgi:hypothetical protein
MKSQGIFGGRTGGTKLYQTQAIKFSPRILGSENVNVPKVKLKALNHFRTQLQRTFHNHERSSIDSSEVEHLK